MERELIGQSTNSSWGSANQWPFVFPLEDGAMIFVEREERRQTLHLFDGRTHAEFGSIEELVRAESRRLRRRLPKGPGPRGVGENALFQLVKDGADRVWWIEPRSVGVLRGETVVTARREDLLIGGQAYFSFTWIMPWPKGESVLLADHGQVSLLQLAGGKLTTGVQREPRGASLRDTGSWWPRFVPDRAGRLWVSSRQSEALDERLNVVAQQDGQVLLCDAEGGVWFVDYNHSLEVGLVRLNPDGTKSELRLPGMNGPPCLGPRKTVWVLTQRGLVQVSYRRDRLEVVAEGVVEYGGDARIWCDGEDRVWVAGRGPGSQSVMCFNTRW